MVTLILLAVFVAVTFALWREGTWSGLVMLLNVLLAASLATAWYPVIVARIEPALAGEERLLYRHLVDFVALQGLFCLLLLAFREVTDRVSRTRVRFRRPVELVAGPIVAALTAWVMVCFTAATLQTAPLPRAMIQPTPEARMFLGFAPDRRWLAWVRGSTVNGPFARPANPFDPKASFIVDYRTWTATFEEELARRAARK